jgi:hypothetical protein
MIMKEKHEILIKLHVIDNESGTLVNEPYLTVLLYRPVSWPFLQSV